MKKNCYNCGTETAKELFHYPICDSCKSNLKLLTETTINKHYAKNPEAFSNEIQSRLDYIEIDYISKKIKLLHVKEIISK
jgi:arsenate reductase-like glutaredoxin family protein